MHDLPASSTRSTCSRALFALLALLALPVRTPTPRRNTEGKHRRRYRAAKSIYSRFFPRSFTPIFCPPFSPDIYPSFVSPGRRGTACGRVCPTRSPPPCMCAASPVFIAPRKLMRSRGDTPVTRDADTVSLSGAPREREGLFFTGPRIVHSRFRFHRRAVRGHSERS